MSAFLSQLKAKVEAVIAANPKLAVVFAAVAGFVAKAVGFVTTLLALVKL